MVKFILPCRAKGIFIFLFFLFTLPVRFQRLFFLVTLDFFFSSVIFFK